MLCKSSCFWKKKTLDFTCLGCLPLIELPVASAKVLLYGYGTDNFEKITHVSLFMKPTPSILFSLPSIFLLSASNRGRPTMLPTVG